MAFSEKLKLKVKKKAHYKCCVCGSFEFLHVHHIVPQEDGGPDTEANTAPLCTRCHDAYGDNPKKRKWIKEKRDFWYEHCEKKLSNENPDMLLKMYSTLKETKQDLKDLKQEFDQPKQQLYDIGHIVNSFYGSVFIKYGENAKTVGKHELLIQATKEIDKLPYFNGNSNAEIFPQTGFSQIKTKRFKKLRNFDSWDGTVGSGPFSNLHKINLPLQKMIKSQKKKVIFKVRQKIHYQELTENADMTSHSYYFRLSALTNTAVLKYRIPNGKITNIVSFVLSVEDNNHIIFEKEIQNSNEQHFLMNKYGLGWIRKNTKHTCLYWSIPRKLQQGHICKLLWTTQQR